MAHQEARHRAARLAGCRASLSQYITRREAARRLGVSRWKVEQMVEAGAIHTEVFGGRRCILAWEFWRAFRR